MKIVETHDIHENNGYEDSGKGLLSINMYNDDGDFIAGGDVMAGEPEDAVFFRDLAGAYGFIHVVKAAYKAGKDGIDVEFELIDEQAPEYSPIAQLRNFCGNGEVGDGDWEDVTDLLMPIGSSENYSVKVVDHVFEEGGRWYNIETTVYEVMEDEGDGERCAYFELERDVPASETQEGMDLDYSLREAIPQEVTVTKYVAK